MSTRIINVKSWRCCAICKNWYDPCNEAIRPSNPIVNKWEIDKDVRRKCLYKNLETNATACCGKFENKIMEG